MQHTLALVEWRRAREIADAERELMEVAPHGDEEEQDKEEEEEGAEGSSWDGSSLAGEDEE